MSSNGDRLKRELVSIAVSMGAINGRVADLRALQGPPSADPTYALPNAKSAIAFAVSLGKDWLPEYFGKVTRQVFRQVMYNQYQLLGKIGDALVKHLEAEGFSAFSPSPNSCYRKEVSRPEFLIPDFSHRFAAVASGLGTFGWSGNVLVEGHGAAVLLGGVVTKAELEPDPPAEESLCDNCRICARVCPWEFTKLKEEQACELGGRKYVYNAKGHHSRCGIVCAGLVGRSRNGKWSSWSPNPHPFEEKDENLGKAFKAALANPVTRQVRLHVGYDQNAEPTPWRLKALEGKRGILLRPYEDTHPTCCNCALVCSGPLDWRKKLMKLLHASGVVNLSEDGREIAVKVE